jgi:protein TonB
MQICRPCTFIASLFLCLATIACAQTSTTQTIEPSGDGTVASPMHIGKGDTPPRIIYQAEPDFKLTEDEKKHMGSIQVKLIVDEQGLPQNVQAVHCTYEDLCQTAIEAVRKYRFKPAIHQGHPVAVDLFIDINVSTF